ncbi:hypothetical protein NDU88_002974 [Pleurodeles waltl]|uniref:Uncharacterized protein n=1 Tax=Pleurodeles waltl TaxID=8319 RepID=A0AAV7KW85_PLEWA|nr:hypothetical protein NDU88_002974 [Pleurodeles waltl]
MLYICRGSSLRKATPSTHPHLQSLCWATVEYCLLLLPRRSGEQAPPRKPRLLRIREQLPPAPAAASKSGLHCISKSAGIRHSKECTFIELGRVSKKLPCRQNAVKQSRILR